jgi:hypothetical protein
MHMLRTSDYLGLMSAALLASRLPIMAAKLEKAAAGCLKGQGLWQEAVSVTMLAPFTEQGTQLAIRKASRQTWGQDQWRPVHSPRCCCCWPV